MKVAIWDTNVLREDGKIMHFDILVRKELKDEELIFSYGRTYIKSKPFKTKELTSDECVFCHTENLDDDLKQLIIKEIKQNGYYIIELENCN